MYIAGEFENTPSWVADWPHCCDFLGDTCDDLRWCAMLLEPQNYRKTAHFIAKGFHPSKREGGGGAKRFTLS